MTRAPWAAHFGFTKLPFSKTILAKEDKYFYAHPGVNPVAMLKSFFDNVLHGKIRSGASTITMQVARALEPKPRTYWNKLREIFRAEQLELKYKKDEILQLLDQNFIFVIAVSIFTVSEEDQNFSPCIAGAAFGEMVSTKIDRIDDCRLPGPDEEGIEGIDQIVPVRCKVLDVFDRFAVNKSLDKELVSSPAIVNNQLRCL